MVKEVGYDTKADIWSLGITILEMAEGRPPNSEVHPMRAIFLIPSKPPPSFAEPQKWGADIRSFLALCLNKDPVARPTASQLLEVPKKKKVFLKRILD